MKKFAFLAVLLFSFSVVGCTSLVPHASEVIKKPQTCFTVPPKPELLEVKFSVEEMKNGEWAITIDDANFDRILLNHIRVDNYITRSYNTLEKYNNECSK